MWGSVIDPAPPQPVLRVDGGALGLDGGGGQPISWSGAARGLLNLP